MKGKHCSRTLIFLLSLGLIVGLAACGGGAGGGGGGGSDPVENPPPPTPTPGLIGQTYTNINGTARFHTAGNSPSLDLGDQSGEDFTIEFWMNITSMPAAGECDAIVTDDGYGVLLCNTGPGWGLRLALYPTGGGSIVSTQYFYTTPPIGTWAHVALQFEQSTGKVDFALNGSFSGGTPGSSVLLESENEPFYIGGNPAYVSSANIFKGILDCLRVSNILRYSGVFVPPAVNIDSEYSSDGSTRGLWWFNDGIPYGDPSGNGNTLVSQ